jgi:hypothetical protein
MDHTAAPLGKPRSPWVSLGLMIITLGIYALVWVYKTYDEMRRHTGEGMGPLPGLLLHIFVSPVTYFLIPYRVRIMHERKTMTSPVTGLIGFWVLLPVIGWIVWLVKVQRALNAYWVSQGATPLA